jgi:hypothetical protein
MHDLALSHRSIGKASRNPFQLCDVRAQGHAQAPAAIATAVNAGFSKRSCPPAPGLDRVLGPRAFGLGGGDDLVQRGFDRGA